MHTSVFLYTARVSVGKQKAQEFFHFMLVFKQRDGFSQQDAAVDAHLAFEVAVVQLQWVDEPFEAPDETCSCWIVFSCRFYGNFSQHIYTVYTHRIFIYIIICIITYIYIHVSISYIHIHMNHEFTTSFRLRHLVGFPKTSKNGWHQWLHAVAGAGWIWSGVSEVWSRYANIWDCRHLWAFVVNLLSFG